jgi:hypothetical protein
VQHGEAGDLVERDVAHELEALVAFAPTPRFLSLEKTATMADHLNGRVAKADTRSSTLPTALLARERVLCAIHLSPSTMIDIWPWDHERSAVRR